MAITDAYATVSQYRSVVGKTDTAQDEDIQIDLTAISRYLDGKLGRFFTKDIDDVARIYVPARNLVEITVDDLSTDPTSIEIDEDDDGTYTTTLAETDYELLPYNADKGPEPWPYTRIGLTPWGNYSCFYKGIRVKVTGKFGWPTVPESIRQATIQLAAILRLETPRATRRIAELGDVMETSHLAQNIVQQLVRQYKVWNV